MQNSRTLNLKFLLILKFYLPDDIKMQNFLIKNLDRQLSLVVELAKGKKCNGYKLNSFKTNLAKKTFDFKVSSQ